jgi:hypothetical protein
VVLARPAAEYASVQTWRNGLAEQWGEEPADFDQRVALLEAFCELTDRDPDEMIADCTREVDSGKRIRIKARREYSERIAEFQKSAGDDARAQGRAGNIIRSFFIHNGIFMQAGLS